MQTASRRDHHRRRPGADPKAADGVEIRPLTPEDRGRLADAFALLGEETRRRRFGAVAKRLSERDLDRLSAIDHHGHEALAAITPETGQIVGIARYIELPEARASAEVAVAVADDWQRRGIARRLLAELTRRARAEGITDLLAYVATGNRPVRSWIARLGGIPVDHYGDEVLYRISLVDHPAVRRAA